MPMTCQPPYSRFGLVSRSTVSRRLLPVQSRRLPFRLQCSKSKTPTTDGKTAIDNQSPPALFSLGTMLDEMKDSQELGARGEGWMLAIFLACGFLVFPPVKLYGLVSAVGWIVASAGVVLCVFSLISLGKNNFPLPHPRKNAEFVQRGIYAHVRHPMYGGILLIGIGLATITKNEVMLSFICFIDGVCVQTRGVFCVLLWGLMERLIRFEEGLLKEKFPAYNDYCKRTSKFFP
eukprot:g4887.t1